MQIFFANAAAAESSKFSCMKHHQLCVHIYISFNLELPLFQTRETS